MVAKAVAALVCAIGVIVLGWIWLGSGTTDGGLGGEAGAAAGAPAADPGVPPPLAPAATAPAAAPDVGPNGAGLPTPPAGPTPVSTAQVPVAKGERVSGTVRDRTGAPVAGAEVMLTIQARGGPLVAAVQTGPDGRFALDAPGAGPAHVEIRASGQPVVSRPVEPGVTVAVDLTPPAQISGRLQGPQGQGVGGAFVRADLLDTTVPTSVVVQTGADGSFEFNGLGDGARYRLRGSHPHYAAGPPEDVTAPARDVHLTLLDGATLIVQVLGPDGTPLPELAAASGSAQASWLNIRSYAVLSGAGAARTLSNWADADRIAIRFEGLAPGTYRVEAGVRGYGRATTGDVVVNGGEVEATLALAGGGFVNVTVLDSDSAPAGGVTLQPAAQHDSPWGFLVGGVTDDQGQVRLGPFPPGPTTLRATAGTAIIEGQATVVIGGETPLDLRLPKAQ